MSPTKQSSKPIIDPGTKEILHEQAKAVGGDIAELVALGKEAVEEVAGAARDRAVTAKDDATAKVSDFEDQIVRYVREQPVKSILWAAGAGMIASMWLRRK